MPTTSNFGWTTPADTDLVKDGALAIRTLGNNIDTSLVDLKGGTTGQVLSKASNSDLDYTWVTTDDADAIQNAIVDAKGDLIAASANDTPARLAVGNNGETLVADSSATTGLRWQGNYAAAKNVILNSDFRIWQRGTSFSNPAAQSYLADRYATNFDGTGATRTISQQTFTAGTAPVSGYEGLYFLRADVSVAGTGNTFWTMSQRIEDVRTFANQTVTVSFWAKSDSSRNVKAQIYQNFGTGGSSAVFAGVADITATTSWTRFSATINIPSISGKTIGTNSHLELRFVFPAATVETIDLWGIQLEAGSVATAFQTATGSLGGELALCQRYYFRYTPTGTTNRYGSGLANTTTDATIGIQFPVVMRTAPSAMEQSGTAADYSVLIAGGAVTCSAVPALNNASANFSTVSFTVASGLTAGQSVFGRAVNTNAYLGWSAEL